MVPTASQVFLQRLSRHTVNVVIAIGLLALIGWGFGIVWFKSIRPQFVAMNPLTAILFIVLAGALELLSTSPGRAKKWTAGILAAAVVTVAALKLAEYAGTFEFNLDEALFQGALKPTGHVTPNQIAPNTALNFLFCGLGVLLLEVKTPRGFCPAQGSFLVAALVSVLALIGYTYRVLPLYQFGSAMPMALNTAIAFGLFCFAALAARPNHGIMRVITSDTRGGAMARRLLPAAIIVPFLLGTLQFFGERRGYFEIEYGASLFAVANMVIFSLLIWWNAKLLFMAEREQAWAERRLAVQYAVTRVLAAFPADATAKILETIGTTLNWPFGAMWVVDGRTQTIRCEKIWRAAEMPETEFELTTREKTFIRGESFPGAVWKTGEPLWLQDMAGQKAFPRSETAVKSGLHGGFAFPLRFDSTIFGVMEFFSREIEPPDDALLKTMGAIGSQIGQFIERRRAEEQLKQTTAELARSNTELQQFAYIASHDLSEPLRMVVSYLQLLVEHTDAQLDQESKEFIGYAVDGAQRMQALINDLLAYARVDTRSRPFQPVNCEEVLLIVITNLKVALQESQTTVEHDPLPTVNGDEIQLTQVFQNLISNAIKFRGRAPLRIHVGAEKAKNEWIFHVRDNGIGIDAKNFERIFVLFQRLHTRQEYAGTGMGLAICKKIIERHGGRIWVESTPGQGATFYFALPDADESRGK